MTILILAAGAPTRMRGGDKLAHQVDGVAQLRRVALAALATGRPVLVTLPLGHFNREAALRGLQVQIVAVAAPEEGMAASIRAGAAACGDGRSVMILPADMPELDTGDLLVVIAAHQAAPKAILRGADGGIDGHPVVIPHDLVPHLQGLKGDQGARSLIVAHADRLQRVALPPGHATTDLDTPDDWAAWESERGSKGPDNAPRLGATEHPSMRDPLAEAYLCADQAVLAVVTGVVGASYRNPGAMMVLFADGRTAGNLTNGCIEGDLAIHAAECLRRGQVRHLRYGAGSPFFDIQLPCGGGLEIALFPRPDAAVLAKVRRWRSERRFFALRFDPAGGLSLQDTGSTGWQGMDFVIDARPDVQFVIFGDGPEAVVFTRLVQSSGYAHRLLTSTRDTFEALQTSGSVAEYHARISAPDPASFDSQTAVVTFFHDHDQEIPILAAALRSAAFYVGAQGSHRVADRQRARLQGLDLGPDQLAKFRSPIGLIPSARDPRTLAESVLAEVIKLAAEAG